MPAAVFDFADIHARLVRQPRESKVDLAAMPGVARVYVREINFGDHLGIAVELKDGTRNAVRCKNHDQHARQQGERLLADWVRSRA